LELEPMEDACSILDAVQDIASASIDMVVYPNPASDLIIIEIDGPLSFEVNLYNLEGKLISTSINVNQIKVKSISPGSYLLEIRDLDSNQKIIERIVISR